jgi:hypothetical protein
VAGFASDRQVLDQPLRLFDQTLQALRYGGSTLDTSNDLVVLPPRRMLCCVQLDDGQHLSLFREQWPRRSRSNYQRLRSLIINSITLFVLSTGATNGITQSFDDLPAVWQWCWRRRLHRAAPPGAQPLTVLDNAAQRKLLERSGPRL